VIPSDRRGLDHRGKLLDCSGDLAPGVHGGQAPEDGSASGHSAAIIRVGGSGWLMVA
jgi:hypothetical protein